MTKLNFQQPLLQSSVSHDPSEIMESEIPPPPLHQCQLEMASKVSGKAEYEDLYNSYMYRPVYIYIYTHTHLQKCSGL